MTKKLPDWMEEDPDIQKMLKQIHLEKQLESETEFPPESFEEFSEAPLEFEDMAASLREDLEDVYTMTGTINRYSPDYPAACAILEKMIRRMGSFCVTKAVLEQKGFAFPSLKDLDLKDLYCMVSFNFRKTRTAYHDGKRLKGCADMGMLALECRWVDLAEQLKATGEKIRLIRSGKINVDSMLERAEMFKGGQDGSRMKAKTTRMGTGKARSLPVIGSVARQMIAEKKEALKSMNEQMPGMPGVRMFREARPFGPSKKGMELIRQDEERARAEEEAEENEMLEMISRGEVPIYGTPIPASTGHPSRVREDKKARKKRRREAALARKRN